MSYWLRFLFGNEHQEHRIASIDNLTVGNSFDGRRLKKYLFSHSYPGAVQ